MIDVGGGWRTGCGSHPQSTELVEELEDSVCSVVRQENECEDQGKVYRTVVRTAGTGARAETLTLKKAQERKSMVA